MCVMNLTCYYTINFLICKVKVFQFLVHVVELLCNANIFVGYKFQGFVKILILRKINLRIAGII